MARKAKPKPRPSFFKVLIKDYTTTLRLPHAFVKKYENVLPENAKLRTSSGETWEVKLEEIDDENYCFTWGWTKFANNMELRTGEFLVFWFNIGKSSFDVSVYGTSGCERKLSDKNLMPAEDSDHAPGTESDSETDHESDDLGMEMHPHFQVVLNESLKSGVSLPKEFAEAAGLVGKRVVVLEYPPKDRYWAAVLDDRSNLHFPINLASGWEEFRNVNGLVMGKTYSFEFNPTKNVIEVKEHKSRQAGI